MAKNQTKQAKQSTVTLLKGASAIEKAIASIANRGKKLDLDIHQAACSTLAHAIECGDVTLAAKLVAAMPKSGRAKALMAWYVAHGPFAVEKGNLVYLKGESDLAKAIATPFWEFLPEPSPVQFDLAETLAKVLARAEKAAASEQQDLNRISPALLAELRRLVHPNAADNSAQATVTSL